MLMRLVDIEPFETEKDISSCKVTRWHCGDGYANMVVTDTKDIPTIEAELVKHGKWDDEHKCTNCGIKALCEEKPDPYHPLHLLALFYVDSDYCPNCGATMDLED